MATVKFTAMKDGDKEDYEFLTAHEIDYAARTGDRLLDALVQLDEGLSGYKITRLGHSLQAATRAWRVIRAVSMRSMVAPSAATAAWPYPLWPGSAKRPCFIPV